ncbi:Phosphopantetheine attachment site [Actinomadura meyerae]|uniref:Phosphopantetheine attachment site n=1 Tax=Actinomadura meyerae TaxID=240840 RepID=A0A239P105_9ACTN|nr:phosphopantetheine-binding protein [Actinomadura meyerae]SNT60817.1 Phosphopantetheine attachment site [Actinomadura meyerae]
MTSIDDFLELVRAELGLEVTAADAARSLDEVEGWDSLLLLTLAVSLESATGRRVRLPDLLEASSLEGIFKAAVRA